MMMIDEFDQSQAESLSRKRRKQEFCYMARLTEWSSFFSAYRTVNFLLLLLFVVEVVWYSILFLVALGCQAKRGNAVDAAVQKTKMPKCEQRNGSIGREG
jgi:hypothetical protein